MTDATPASINPTPEPTNGGRVTVQQFYTELLRQSIERGEMERRIMARLDDICARGTPVMVLKVSEVEEQVKTLAITVAALQKAIAPLVFANKILTWVAIAFGTSIIVLIWGILIHQVTIGVPGVP